MVDSLTIAMSQTGEQGSVANAELQAWATNLVEHVLMQAAIQADDTTVGQPVLTSIEFVVVSSASDALEIALKA